MVFILVTLVLSISVYYLFGVPSVKKTKSVNPYKELKSVSELSKDYLESLIKKAKTPSELKWVLAYLFKNDKTINLYVYDRVKLINQTKKRQEQLLKQSYLERIVQNYKESKLG